MSLAGPAPDGFYQACFFDSPTLEAIHAETIDRAHRAGYEVAGPITVAPHVLSYLGEFVAEVIIATVPVVIVRQESMSA